MKNEDNDRLFTVYLSRGFGSTEYMSRAALRRQRLCAFDDLENLAHVLLELAKDDPTEWDNYYRSDEHKKNADLKDKFWTDQKVRSN